MDKETSTPPKVKAEPLPEMRSVALIEGAPSPRIEHATGAMAAREQKLWETLSKEEHHTIQLPDFVQGSFVTGEGWVLLAALNGVRFYGVAGQRYTVPCSVGQRAYLAGAITSAPCEKARNLKHRMLSRVKPLALNTVAPWTMDRRKAGLRDMLMSRTPGQR